MVPDVCGSVMADVILNLCPLSNVVWMVIRLRSTRWAGHVEYVIGKINAYKVFIGRTEVTDCSLHSVLELVSPPACFTSTHVNTIQNKTFLLSNYKTAYPDSPIKLNVP